MRKFAVIAAILFVLSLVTVPSALAGTVTLTLNNVTPNTTTFTVSGTYASGTPTTMISAAGMPYSISFTILTNPSSLSSFQSDSTDGLFLVGANFDFTFGGSTMSLGNFLIEFDTLGGGNLGGMIFCLDNSGTCASNTGWNIFGTQLFTGSVNDPKFISAPNGVFVSNASTYEINGVGPFDFGGTPTPEPASLLLLGTGLVGIGALVRKRLRSF